MGTGVLFFILAILLVPLGLGILIGYFIGKAKASKQPTFTSQGALAKAWQEGYEAARAETTLGSQQPQGQPTGRPPRPQPLQTPPLHAPQPRPGAPLSTGPQQQPVAAAAGGPTLAPAHQTPPPAWQTRPGYGQGMPTAAGYTPPRLTAEELAAKRERDQIRNANILLYVAALLMVGTGMLFLAAGFPTVVTISALAIVTAGFYAAGLLLHKTSQRLRSSGTAFSGTGLALYPILALAAATQLWPGSPVPWLVFSLIGSIAFSVAAAVLNSRVVAFLTLPFLLSAGITAGAVLRSGMVWSFVFTIVLATIISWFAAERPRWVNNIFIQAFVSTHEYIVPATLLTQAFLFNKIPDLQNSLVFGSALLYYITRTALSAQKHRLYYLSAARVLFLLTLWQVLRTFNVSGSTIATIMAVAIALTMVATLLAQRQYAHLLHRSERSRRFASNWLRSDLAIHAAALIILSVGSETNLNPNTFGKGDWAALNLPLVITMIAFAIVILLQQRRSDGDWWGAALASPLWFLAAPFWLARSGEANYGAEFFRPELFWILGLIGFAAVFWRRRHQAVAQLAFAAIGGTVLYLGVRTHVGVTDTGSSWQSTTVVVALWTLLAVLWVYAVVKLARWGVVEREELQPNAADVGQRNDPEPPAAAGRLAPALVQRVAERFRLSHRLVGYVAAAAMAATLWSSLSLARAGTITESGHQQGLYYASSVLVLAIVASFGVILLRNLRRAPQTGSTHIALWGWAIVSLLLGIRERQFLNRLDPASINWFSLVFGLLLVAVVWLAGYYTSRLGTEPGMIRARWYQTAAIVGLGYALYHGLNLLQVNPNLLFGIPFVATLGYFVYQAVRDTSLILAPSREDAKLAHTTGRYRQHALLSAGLLLLMPLFLLADAVSNLGELQHQDLYRWLLVSAWTLFTAAVLWYSLGRVFAYLPAAAIGLYGLLHVAADKSAWAGEERITPYLTPQAAGWVSVLAGLVFISLMIVPNVRPRVRERWANAAIWAPLISHLMLSFAAIEFHENGYTVAVCGLGFALGMIVASHREQTWVLRPIAVPVIFVSMLPLAEELRWDLFRNMDSDVPIWLMAGFLGVAVSYLVGLFYTSGGNGKHAARMMRLTALSGFLVFMITGWLDSKAPLVFAVVLTLVALIGLGLEQSGTARRTFLEVAFIIAILGAQRIWSDVPGNVVTQRMGFWFQQHVVIGLTMLAVWTYLRQRQPRSRAQTQRQSQVPPAPARPLPGHVLPPTGVGQTPLVAAGTVTSEAENTRFNVYLYAAVSLLTVASMWLFGLNNSGPEFFYTVAAFVGLIVYGAMRSRTGMLIWGITGTILVLFLFLRAGSFLLLFLLALALMGVGIWQLVRISKRPRQSADPGARSPATQPSYGPAATGPHEPYRQHPFAQPPQGQPTYGQPPTGQPPHNPGTYNQPGAHGERYPDAPGPQPPPEY